MPSTYYLGTSPDEALGESPRYWYALRRNQDGELFFVRSDQLIDKESYEINFPGDSIDDFIDFETGFDYLDGIDADHELEYNNLKYPQYRWDDRPLLYYVDSEGRLSQRIGQSVTYPTGISS